MTIRLRTVAAIAAAGVSTLALTGAALADGSLTVVSWGGAYTKSQVHAYHIPFASYTGVEILSENYNGGLAEIRSQVEAGNVTWDLVDVEQSDAIRGCDEGLLLQIDPGILPPGLDGSAALDDFIEGTVLECAVPSIVWSTIYAYDSTVLTEGPTSIADFYDLEAFPGRRGLRRSPKANLEMALMGSGVPAAEVYDVLATEEGVDRAFAALDTIKDEVVWWEAGAQPPQLLADGEVVMTTAYNGRIFNAVANEDRPFEIVWDGQILDLDLWVIPEGAPNADTALEFIAYTTGSFPLAHQADYISYGPARQSSFPHVAEEMQAHMPTAPNNLENALPNDELFWADYQDELNERFNAWLNN